LKKRDDLANERQASSFGLFGSSGSRKSNSGVDQALSSKNISPVSAYPLMQTKVSIELKDKRSIR
jgi:hypothetical protein